MQWDSVTKGGESSTILDTARTTNANLIVMTTEGRNGFLECSGEAQRAHPPPKPMPATGGPGDGVLTEALKRD